MFSACRIQRFRFVSAALLVGLIVLVAAGWPRPVQGDSGPQDNFRSAWQRANAATSYRFTAQIEQTFIPRAVPEMIGQQNQGVDLHLDGEVQQPDRARIDLTAESQSGPATPVTLVREGDRTFIQKNGELLPAETPELIIPNATSNFFDYLAAADNIRLSPDRSSSNLHYTFDLNTARFVDQLVGRFVAAGVDRPVLPDIYNQMTGAGELWVDASGLPVRQIVHLNLPRVSDQYDARIRFVLDLRDWGGVAALPKPVPNGHGTWTLSNEATPSATGTWRLSDDTLRAMLLLAVAGLLASAFSLWYQRRRKAATVFIVMVVCFALIFSTPLQLLSQSIQDAAPRTSLAQALDLPAPAKSPEQQKIEELLQQYGPQSADAAVAKCGDGSPGVDTDQDGLTDQQEACLGTGVYLLDSDGDGLSDGLEVLGFDYAGRHWTGNPLNVDSNADGASDSFEWPDPANINSTADTDRDNVPNLWDSDDDNDGLSDAIDLSPLAVTPYSTTFKLQTDARGFTGTQYVEIEVQPQNQAHLQYSLTALDWPADEEGQVMELNKSTDDLRLTPMLEIETNISPTLLSKQYGYSIQSDGTRTRLYVPAQPVSDGGAYRAFYGKVAYAPSELSQPIQWTARLVWMVQVQNDSQDCYAMQVDASGKTTCIGFTVRTETDIPHIYRTENFRVTGLKITKSLGFEAAAFGTPQYPNEDHFLFQTIFGMSAIFLQYDRVQNQAPHRTALQELAYRFAQPGTPPDMRFNLPTTVTLVMSDTTYAHLDEGLAALNQQTIPQLLNAYYASPTPDRLCQDSTGASFACAVLGIASEYTVGSIDLENIVPTNTVQLNAVPLIRQRSLKAVMYEQTPSGAWTADGIARTLEIVGKRYNDQMTALLTQLQVKHPQANQNSVQVAAFLPYIAWWSGTDRPVQFDAETLLEPNLSDEKQVINDSLQVALFNTVTVVEMVFDLKDVMGGPGFEFHLLSRGKLGAAVGKVNDFFTARNGLARKVLGVSNAVMFAASLAVSIAKIACGPEKENKCDAQALKTTETVIRSVKVVGLAIEVVDAFGQLTHTPFSQIGTSFAAKYAKNALKQIKSVSGAVAIIGTVVAIGLAWTQFGLIAANSNGYTISVKIALANAIASTIWAIITLALSFIPFGIGELIVAILGVIDAIVQAITGGEYDLATGLRKLFYDIKIATTLDGQRTRFQDKGTGLANSALGVVQGNTFQLHDSFEGTIIKTSDGSDGDLNSSYAEGYFAVAGGPNTPVNATRSPRVCITANGERKCTNDLTAEFKLITYTINAKLEFINLIDFQYVYKECTFLVWCHTTNTEKTTLPSAEDLADSKVTVYLDVLPATLDELWNWSVLVNPDRDGDSLADTAEARLQTDPLMWDTDGDGLSDANEINRSLTNPLKGDTDGDGLTDSFEIRIDTDPLTADSDNDGLSDGAEVFHFDGTQWVGGWMVTLPGGLQARVFSDPLNADYDGDGLYDSAERENQLSPNAYNVASHVELDAEPLSTLPGSTTTGVWGRPNTPVTYTLYLIAGQSPITRTLSACFPALLTNLTVQSTGGNRRPTATNAACTAGNRIDWNFGGANTLQIGEYFTATVTARTDPAATASVTGTVAINVAAGDKVLSDSLRVVLDADLPGATITAPHEGEILRRDPNGTTYIVGGVTTEPSSWVEAIELNTGVGYTLTQGTNVWAYAWNLPADGTHTLQARSRDHVGYTSVVNSISVIVDGTPPTATLGLADNIYLRPTVSGTIQLNGTASDNLAGLAFIQISIDSKPWQNVLQIPANSLVLNANWNYTWTLPMTADASGAYRVAVRAVDRANNISAAFARKVVVDLLPPTDDLTTNIYFNTPDVQANVPLTLTGRANDLGNAPLPSRPQSLQGTLSTIMSATVWLQYSKVGDDDQGVRITWLGDTFGGDARADLAVGLPASDNGAGRVAVINGRGGNWPVPPNAEAIFESRSSFVGAASANLGQQVASAGDVNADGFFDILIGDPANNRAFLIFGRGQPLGRHLPLTGTSEAAIWTVLNVAGLGALTEVTSAGDVNGDGFDDVWLTVNSNNSYLILGHSKPWYPLVDVGQEAAAVGHANHATATGVGDVNGDHIDDYTITGYNAVYLFLGQASLAPRGNLSLDGRAIWAVGSATSEVKVTPLGDINGDELSDFVFDNGSTPALVLGRSSGAWGISQSLSYNPVASGFIAAPGDVNADGLNDILLGVPSNDSAYLILGQQPFPASPPVAATLTGVAGAASAPYATGADLNCDLSADLLLLPTQIPPVTPLGPASPFEDTTFVPQAQLPVAPTPDLRIQPQAPTAASEVLQAPTAIQVIVDDDGGPGVDFTSIQEAVDYVISGWEIIVRPGVYTPFTVTSSAKDFISIIGDDPDAVFVDGGGGQRAILLQNVAGVKIFNLTLRNAQRLIELQGAGVAGETTLGRIITLDHLVLHSFNANAITMDRTSTVDVQRTTIANNSGSGAYLYVDPTTPDPVYPNPSWIQRANLPFNAGTGSQLMSRGGGGDNLYLLLNTVPITFQQYISATNSWRPRAMPAGITAVPVAGSGGFTLVMIVQVGGVYYPAYYNSAPNVWFIDNPFPVPFTPGVGAAIVGETNPGRTYILAGGGSSFYLYIPSTGWTPLASAPFSPGVGAALAWGPGENAVYALAGGNTPGFYRYDVAANTWTQLDNAPFNVSSGAGMTWDGGLYATAGGGSQAMAYFDETTNRWRDLALSTPNAINAGGGLASVYPDLYEIGGGNTASFYRFGPAGMYPAVKAIISGTAFVGPANAAATTYYNLTYTYLDFDLDVPQSQWVGGGTWTPAVATVLPYASASFVNPTVNVYRTDPGTVLTTGYFTPRGDVYVSADYCASCSNDGRTWGVDAFASIQAAIDSQARRVLILPGVYNETFHLVSGVQVIGSGAESTIIQLPAGSTSPALVNAEGVAAASLARLTLAGNGAVDGVHVDGGATAVKISRVVIRNTYDAVVLDDSATEVEIVNNTVVKNTHGIVAMNNAGVDVRNTIFAFNTIAVSYLSGAPTQLHQYNDYFANGFDLLVDFVPQAANGPGEITIDPLFADLGAHNYRPLPDSPVIDAGNPTDPTPPGAGRVDMGYSEGGQAAFYASGNYCAQCVNDGLEWQVDAFNRIQPALDAAARYLRAIGCSDITAADQHGFCNTHVTVGVSAGYYYENVRVPSYVRLTGINADTTVIDANGSGSAVTFDGVVDAQVSRLTIANSGFGAGDAGVRVLNASNLITITRNLILFNSGLGIAFSGGASGNVMFNTMFYNAGTNLSASGANTWAEARDNIVTNSFFGAGLETDSGGTLLSNYNLVGFNAANYVGVAPGQNDLIDVDPQFVDIGGVPFDLSLQPASPAVDAAESWASAPVGGGERADLGYKETVATPLTLFFGKLSNNACFAGNSGVAQVEVGVVPVADPNSPITATLPFAWDLANVLTPGQTASYWTKVITPTSGLARLYSRATDMVGNTEALDYDPSSGPFQLYDGAFIGDGQVPTVTLTAPPDNTSTTTAAVYMSGAADDRVGERFSVASTYFLVNGTQRVNADWANDGWDGTGPRTFQAIVPLAPGVYTIRAGAQDEAGNTDLSAAHTLTVVAPASGDHVVSFFDPPNSPWTNQPALRLAGAALFSSVQNNVVTLTVNGGPTIPTTLDAPLSANTTWWANVTLSPGSNLITARPRNDNGVGKFANLLLALDTVPPTLNTPPSGMVISQTATLNGTAFDALSGLDTVEVSVDGGYLWQPATVIGASWTFVWNAPLGKQNTSYPLAARARDKAGNVTTQSFVVVVDNIPPSGFEPVSFNIPIGSYLQSAQTLIMTWTTPLDNGGPVTVTASINQLSTTIPSAVMAGNTLAGNLNLDGKWYAHLAAYDLAQNRISADYGPWYVNTGQLCLNPQRTIQLDGQFDTANGEWLASEFMDDDERPSFSGSPVARDRQTLYTTWDANAFYFGWHGAWWTLDGTMFIYLDTGTGGTPQPITATLPATVLPFAADYAVAISGPAQGTLYQFDGSAWQAQGGMTFAHSGLGDTEVRVPISLGGLSDVRMLAFALSDSDAVWSVFPTTNPLNGPWMDAYHWQPICAVAAPNANQPRGVSVLTALSSPQSSGTPYAPLTALQYSVALDNREARAVANVQVTMTASAGLTYQAVDSPAGSICTACTAGSSQWLLTLPTIPTATTTLITFTGQLAANLTTLPIVTGTLTASAGVLPLSGASVTHLTDGVPPTVAVLYAIPPVLHSGANDVFGQADDGTGIGVDNVEIRPVGAAQWQVVTGTAHWQGVLNVPSAPTFSIEVRATDFYNQISPLQVYTFTVDDIGPIVTMTLPAFISSTLTGFTQINGTASDPFPSDGLVSQVEVQTGDAAAPWFKANGPYSPTQGSQGWSFTWPLPNSDGVPVQFRARATDMADNLTVGAWQTTTVDTVAPVITVTTYISQIDFGKYLSPSRTGPPVLTGTVTDGGGIAQMWAEVYGPHGTTYIDDVTRTGHTWSYIPFLSDGVGIYTVRLYAIDLAGNTRPSGFFVLTPPTLYLPLIMNKYDAAQKVYLPLIKR